MLTFRHREANNIKLWQLRDQDPLPTFIKGRTVLIGDAAHAMTPHQAQGGTQSIEDGEGFMLFNVAGVHRGSVPSILKDFDSVRRPRASRIQLQTRDAQQRRDPDKIYSNTKYNFMYPGIQECLLRQRGGQPTIAT